MYRGTYPPEVLDPVSETIPDQALTVRDIITRFSRGQMELPPLETGESDDIDSSDTFDDMVDASEAFERGAAAYNDMMSNSTTHGQEKVVDAPVADSGATSEVDSQVS